MLGVEMYHAIMKLHSQNHSQRKIAELLSLSKTTVNRYLNLTKTELNSLLLSGHHQSQFGVAAEFIKNKLEIDFTIRITKLYRLVIEKYPYLSGTRRAFHNYVIKLKPEIEPKKIRYFQPIVNDKPGHQVQVDPGEYNVNYFTEMSYKVYFIVFVFSFSRKKYVHFQLRPYNTNAFVKAHLEAFQYFGAIAKEYVYDQTKLVAIQEKYREVIFNERFHKFAFQYEFEPRVCEGYDPQSKGKVERVVREVKEDFFCGEYFQDIADIRIRSLDWLERVNNEKHTVTGKAPDVLFIEELKFMRHWYQSQTENRKADKVGLISYKGNKYSVPLKYQRHQVQICPKGGILLIINKDNNVIAEHDISNGKNLIIKNNNHYRDFSKVLHQLKIEAKAILNKYDNSDLLVERLVGENPKIARDQLRGLIKIYNRFNEQDWQMLINKSLQLRQLRTSRIEEIANDMKKKDLLNKIESVSSSSDGVDVGTSSIQRALNKYMEVLHD